MPPGKKPVRLVKPAQQKATGDLKLQKAVEQKGPQIGSYIAEMNAIKAANASPQQKRSLMQRFKNWRLARKNPPKAKSTTKAKPVEKAKPSEAVLKAGATQEAERRQVVAMAQKAAGSATFTSLCQKAGYKDSPAKVFVHYFNLLQKQPKMAIREFDAAMDAKVNKQKFNRTRFYAELIAKQLKAKIAAKG